MSELSERARAILRGHTHVARYWRREADGMDREHCHCGASRLTARWHDGSKPGPWKEKENA